MFFDGLWSAAMVQKIVIYQDDGVGEFGLLCLRRFFERHDVHLCDAADVIEDRVLENADLFVMPGGADLPYCAKLNGTGNKNIRAYVENGGTYIGFCAGAYYGCAALEFNKGTPGEISGARELAFTDAVAYGSLPDLAPFYDLTFKSAGVARIALPNNDMLDVFYHGGPAFRLGNDDAVTLACYTRLMGQPPAIIERKVGKGRAVLTGVHLEISANDLPNYPVSGETEKALLDTIIATMKNTKIHPHDILRTILWGG